MNWKKQPKFVYISIVVVALLAVDFARNYKPRPWGLPDENHNGLRDDVDEFIKTKLTHLDETGLVLVYNKANMIQEALLQGNYSDEFRRKWWNRFLTETDCHIYYGRYTYNLKKKGIGFESLEYNSIRQAKIIVKKKVLNSRKKSWTYESFFDGYHMWGETSDYKRKFLNYMQLEEVCGFSEEISNKMRKYYIDDNRKSQRMFMKNRRKVLDEFEKENGQKYRHRYDQYFDFK